MLTGATDGQLSVQEEVAPTTVVDVEAELSDACSSLVALETLALLVMIAPVAASPATVKASVKIAVEFAGRVAMVQVIVPLPPELGVVHVNGEPESCASERKVVPPGVALVTSTFCASSGPWLITSTL